MTSALASGATSWRQAINQARYGNRGPPTSLVGKTPLLSRRPVMAGLALGLALRALPALGHDGVGLVKPPIDVPDISIVSSDGVQGSLREQLLGRVTAVQLMFTKCRSICPIEAATFVRTQEALAGRGFGDIQLLSLSIDPLTDTPDVLKGWLASLNARSGWIAASPAKTDLARAQRFFDNVSSLGEDHSTAMSLMNHAGLLVWRTSELPAPDEVANLLTRLQKLR